jgi:hypothetical protein
MLFIVFARHASLRFLNTYGYFKRWWLHDSRCLICSSFKKLIFTSYSSLRYH